MSSGTAPVFFTKKKIVFITLTLAVFVVFIALLMKYFFNIEMNQIIATLQRAFAENRLFFLWLVLLVGFPIFNCFWRIWPYYLRLKDHNIYVEWYNWIIFCFITFLISSITPFAIGSEPYIIYWINKRGLSTKDAASIVASVMVLNPFVQVLITWPSFFVLAASYGDFRTDPQWVTSFWLVLFGLTIDLIGSVFWLSLSVSRRFHYLINVVWNKFRQLLKLSFKTRAEISNEYVTKAAFRKTFMKQIRDTKFVLVLVCGSLLWNIYYYSSLILSFNLVDQNNQLNPWELFNFINVATTANNFVPIPGAEGSLQAVILIFVNAAARKQEVIIDEAALKTMLDSSVIIWRSFTFYLTAALGAIFFFVSIIKEAYKNHRKKRRAQRGFATKSFTILVPITSFNPPALDFSLASIAANHYPPEQIQVLLITLPTLTIAELQATTAAAARTNVRLYQGPVGAQNWFELVCWALSERLVTKEYLQILEPGSFLNLEIFERINNIPNHYDLYVSRYRRLKANGKISPIISSYHHLRRRWFKPAAMNSSKLTAFNSFVRVQCLTDPPHQLLTSSAPDPYLALVLARAQSLRLLSSLARNTHCKTVKKNPLTRGWFGQVLGL